MEQEKQTSRVSRIEEFLLDPEKTIFELLEEFGNSVEEIRSALSQVDVSNLETLKGEDGKTPERGVDYFTDEDLDNIEAFILDRIPVVGEDVPSPKQVNEYIDKQVAKIPRVKGDKGNPGTPGKPGKNGSPDSALDIIKKLRSLDKNQGLQLNDIRGLSKKIALLNEVSDEFTKLKEDLSNIKILTSGASSDGTGAVASVNGKVGVVVLTQDDIGNGTNYVQTENNFTDALLAKLTGLQTSYSFLNLTDTPSAYTGQAGKFVKVNATNDGLEFASIPGGGDMLASVYDPTNVAGDAFDMDNMAQGTTNKFLSSAELTVVQNTSGTNTGDQEATDFDIKDLTDSTNLRTTWNAKVDKSLFDANTILYATTDDTPVALTIPEQTIVGRKTGGNIEALAIDSDLSSVSANDDTVPSAKATKDYADSKVEDSITDGVTTKAPSQNAVFDELALKDTKTDLTKYSNLNAPEGFLINGKIVPSVASNNLTVAIKGLDGNDPSASNPVYCRIGDVVRTITSALSVTKNAGTNWMNAGSAELATEEIDYFVYLGYNTTDGITIGFSRIPYANTYFEFSTTNTNEKYCAISTITNAVAGDNYRVIGRFGATLSAGAGYTWTVPTFTGVNLIQRPIFETRNLVAKSIISAETGTITTSSGATMYKISGKNVLIYFAGNITNNGSGAVKSRMSLPFTASALDYIVGISSSDGYFRGGYTVSTYWQSAKYDNTYGIVSGTSIIASGNYRI